MKRMEKQSFFALTAWRLGGACVRRAAMTLLLAVMTAATAQSQNTLVSHIECYGSERVVYIEGWVYDSDPTTKWWQLDKNIELKAIVSNTPNKEDDGYERMREVSVEYFARDDVNTAYGLSGKHNFRMEVPILINIEPGEAPSRTLYVKVYATVNNGNGYEDFLLNSPYTEVTMYEIGQEPATEVSEYNSQYSQFTGFIATSGSPDGYLALVDGKPFVMWNVYHKNITVDFHSDKMIVPKGFIINIADGSHFFPTNKMELLAKKDIGDDWTVIYQDYTYERTVGEKTYNCHNDGNNPYKFFRFSVESNDSYNTYLSELKLFGYCNSHTVSIPNRFSPYIEANKEIAYTGETVRLTLDERIDESTLTVSDGTNNLPLTDASFRQYTFTMPDANVTVSAKPHTFALLDDDSAQPVGKKNTDKIAKKEGAANVMLQDRILYRDGDWNTLCLPFPLTTLRDTPLEGFTVMELDGTASHLDGGTLYLNFTPATSIEAGKPYIVKSNSTGVFRVTGASSYDIDPANAMDGHSTAWAVNLASGAAYIEFQASEPVHATNYTMTIEDQRKPTIWRLLAKLNEDDTWTEIDSRNSNENPEDALPVWTSKSFTIQHPGNYQYFRLEISGSAHATVVAIDELEMGIDWLTNITSPLFEWVNVSADAPASVSSTDGAVSFVGSYSPVGLDANDKTVLYLGAANTLYWPSDDMTVGSCRALFRLGGDAVAQVRAFNINFGDEDEETGILSTTDDTNFTDSDDAWYTLDGRKLSGKPSQRGVYIHGGRKVAVQ